MPHTSTHRHTARRRTAARTNAAQRSRAATRLDAAERVGETSRPATTRSTTDPIRSIGAAVTPLDAVSGPGVPGAVIEPGEETGVGTSARPSFRIGARTWTLLGASLALLIVLLGVYANHFHNDFAFDDAHTIVSNPAIRDLHTLPRFFTDATTFSTNPANQGYRPLLTASLALDYHLAGGLKPFLYHIQSFLWYLILLATLFALFLNLLRRDTTERSAAPSRIALPFVALFAVAFFGLHPVSAETVNYIVQRGDLLAALGAAAGLWLYVASPLARRTYLYLIPALLGCLCKQSAIMFGPILFAYAFLFETERAKGPEVQNRPKAPKGARAAHESRSRGTTQRLVTALRLSLPALLLCTGYYLLQKQMTPPTAVTGGTTWWLYALTQPFVILHYALSFFLPLWLSADSDWRPVSGVADPHVWIGGLFLLLLGGLIVRTARRRDTRLIAFGLCWFLLALVPTSSVIPWAEVLNDHRMFFPFIGLALALAQALRLGVEHAPRSLARPVLALVAALLLLAPYAFGTVVRNRVWHTDETLWYDVTRKSPRNGRGLMNYGLSQMSRGRIALALSYFDRALKVTPNYSYLAINRGIALGALGRPVEAEAEFHRAQSLAAASPEPGYYYAAWLIQNGRLSEAELLLEETTRRFPYHIDAQHLLLKVLQNAQRWSEVERVASGVLARFPSDEIARSAQASASGYRQEIVQREADANAHPDRDRLIALSLAYYRAGRYEECLSAAQRARDQDPKSAEAWNNLGAAAASLGRWDQAQEADTKALSLRPDWWLARNNLAYARMMKSRTGASPGSHS